MTRKDVKGDQPSGGETTWTNTGATRYGRGQHKTGSFGDDMLRPSPNHGTQRLPNDDEMMMTWCAKQNNELLTQTCLQFGTMEILLLNENTTFVHIPHFLLSFFMFILNNHAVGHIHRKLCDERVVSFNIPQSRTTV